MKAILLSCVLAIHLLQIELTTIPTFAEKLSVLAVLCIVIYFFHKEFKNQQTDIKALTQRIIDIETKSIGAISEFSKQLERMNDTLDKLTDKIH